MLCQILLVPSHWTMATDRYAGCYSSATVAAEDLFHGAGDLGSLYPPVQTDMTSMSTVLREQYVQYSVASSGEDS